MRSVRNGVRQEGVTGTAVNGSGAEEFGRTGERQEQARKDRGKSGKPTRQE